MAYDSQQWSPANVVRQVSLSQPDYGSWQHQIKAVLCGQLLVINL